MIHLENVSKVYPNGTEALKNITLDISKGEFVFIVGPSGAGKSTFLKLLIREEKASFGKISVNGRDLMTIRKGRIPYLRRTMGIVFQDFRLIDKMNVFDNVAFAMRAIGEPEKAVRKRVAAVLKIVGLEGTENRRPRELSGGEQQRVSLARALVNKPEILIADEPTGNIDPELSFEIMKMLVAINRRGTTVIVVTHEHELVRTFGGRVIRIAEGELDSDHFIATRYNPEKSSPEQAGDEDQTTEPSPSSDDTDPSSEAANIADIDLSEESTAGSDGGQPEAAEPNEATAEDIDEDIEIKDGDGQ